MIDPLRRLVRQLRAVDGGRLWEHDRSVRATNAPISSGSKRSPLSKIITVLPSIGNAQLPAGDFEHSAGHVTCP